VTVSCAFPRKDVEHPLDASGFVTMGPREAAGLKACTFSSSKFDGRAPEGWLLLRAFYRPGPHAGDSDRAWVERATEDLAPTLGLRSAPATAWVARWDRALEIYGPHHAQTLRASLPSDRVPPLGLAGAGVDGLGLSAAVESGLNAAATLQARLGAG
jgi:oxygen-dependent protoporphyrinogen oxidase